MYGGWCSIVICALRPIVLRAIAIASAIEPAVSQPMIAGTVALSAPTTITRLVFSRPRWPQYHMKHGCAPWYALPRRYISM